MDASLGYKLEVIGYRRGLLGMYAEGRTILKESGLDMFDRKSRIFRKSRKCQIREIRDLRCLRSPYLSDSFVVLSLHNPLYNSLLDRFFEPVLHRPNIHSENLSLGYGILLGKVLRKH